MPRKPWASLPIASKAWVSWTFHQAARLAVAFRARHAEVATDFLAYFTAFLVTDDHHWLVVQASDTAHDGGVVGEVTVAVQLIELGKDMRPPGRLPGYRR